MPMLIPHGKSILYREADRETWRLEKRLTEELGALVGRFCDLDRNVREAFASRLGFWLVDWEFRECRNVEWFLTDSRNRVVFPPSELILLIIEKVVQQWARLNLFAEPSLAVFRTEEGEHEIPPDFWLTDSASDAFDPDAVGITFGSTVLMGGYVLISEDAVDRIFTNPKSKQGSRDDRCKPPIQLDDASHGPFLSFLLAAERALGTAGSKRLKKQTVIEWLESHWPAALGEPSANLIGLMATLLRHPDERKGGWIADDGTPQAQAAEEQASLGPSA